MVKGFVKETARDLMALGSIPFFLLVIVRILTVENYNQTFQMLFALFLVGLVSIQFKKMDFHAALIIIVAIFTSVFYASYLYAVFAALIAIVALFMMNVYLNRKMVCKSTLLAIICSIISYFVSSQLGIPNF